MHTHWHGRDSSIWHQGFCTSHAKFEVPIRHPCGDVSRPLDICNLSSEMRLKLEINTWELFAYRLLKERNVDKEKKETPGKALRCFNI